VTKFSESSAQDQSEVAIEIETKSSRNKPAEPIFLRNLIKKEFDFALRQSIGAMICDLLVLVISVSLIFVADPSSKWNLPAGIAGFLIGILRWNLRRRAKKFKAIGDRARRMDLLASTLNWKVPPDEVAILIESFGSKPVPKKKVQGINQIKVKKVDDPGIYALLATLKRRSHMVSNVYRLHSAMCYTATVVSALICISLLMLTPSLASSTNQVEFISRIVLIVLVFLITNDLLASALSFFGSSHAMEVLSRRINGLVENKNATEADCLFVFGDYNALVEQTPPTLRFLYKRAKNGQLPVGGGLPPTGK
jgi:hypothetical protein